MASLKSITSVSTSIINVKVHYFSSIGGYAVTGYNIEVYNSSGNLIHNPIRITGANATSSSSYFHRNGYNITQLYNHRTTANYRVKTYISTTGGNKEVNEVWTRGGSIPSHYTYSITKTSAYLTWGAASDIVDYGVEVHRGSSSGPMVYSNYTSTSRTRHLTGLDPGTTYYYKIYSSGILANGPPVTGTFRTTSPQLPTDIYTLNLSVLSNANTITASWNNVSYESGYRVELYRGASTNPSSSNFIKSKSTTGTSISFYSSDGVQSYSYYTIKVYAYNGDGNGGWKADYIRTSDTEAPTVTILDSSGVGRVWFRYSAYDSGIGLRDVSTYLVAVGSRNGGQETMVDREYTTLTSKSFDKDADGLPFVSGSWYWIGLRAYDKSGNMTSPRKTVRVQYQAANPGDWNWHTPKVAGQPVNITAVEWNSLTTKINQYRNYKGISLVNFYTVSKGTTITATIANQARTAIAQMNPPIVPPPIVSRGDRMTASYFNLLVNSLNSIP